MIGMSPGAAGQLCGRAVRVSRWLPSLQSDAMEHNVLQLLALCALLL